MCLLISMDFNYSESHFHLSEKKYKKNKKTLLTIIE